MATGETTTTEPEMKCARFLTADIIEEILVRLPVGSILRFRSVCKQWRDVLSSRKFILAHLQHASQCLLLFNHRELFAPLYKPTQVSIFDETWSRSTWQASYVDQEDYLFASCNGLLCFEKQSSLEINNPMTGECLHLAKPDRTTFCRFHCEYTFGFHPTTNKYKVVRFLREFDDPERPCQVDSLQVYTLGEEEWREIRAPGVPFLLSLGVVNVDGAMYWITGSKDTPKDITVMSFDLKEEVFTSIRPPTPEREKMARYDPCACDYSITEIDGKVCVVITITHLRIRKIEQYNAPGEFDIWMLDCHSQQKWIPMYNIRWPPGFWSTIHPRVFIHGRKVLLQDITGGLYCYDFPAKYCQLERSSERKLGRQDRPKAVHSYFYKKTLVELDGYAGPAIIDHRPRSSGSCDCSCYNTSLAGCPTVLHWLHPCDWTSSAVWLG